MFLKKLSATSTAVSVPLDGIKCAPLEKRSTHVVVLSYTFFGLGSSTLKSVPREPHLFSTFQERMDQKASYQHSPPFFISRKYLSIPLYISCRALPMNVLRPWNGFWKCEMSSKLGIMSHLQYFGNRFTKNSELPVIQQFLPISLEKRQKVLNLFTFYLILISSPFHGLNNWPKEMVVLIVTHHILKLNLGNLDTIKIQNRICPFCNMRCFWQGIPKNMNLPRLNCDRKYSEVPKILQPPGISSTEFRLRGEALEELIFYKDIETPSVQLASKSLGEIGQSKWFLIICSLVPLCFCELLGE